jgi:hypothetical protein
MVSFPQASPQNQDQLDATNKTVFIDLQDQLNMFRTNICPSSEA